MHAIINYMSKVKEILDKYINYFEDKGHTRIATAPLVPLNDPSTLFTSSGMQPLVPYLLGETHPQGRRLVNVQVCFRAQDIDEVGDNRHTTFFRMLGNWSLGDYFKKEQLPWFFDFLVDPKEGLSLDPSRLYVSVFAGYDDTPKDTESIEIWEALFQNVGISAKLGERIFPYGVEKNWWSRSGLPENMPVGEPGGPDSEVFYDFGTEHNPRYGKTCHINCDCGRFIEIGNSVFMEYLKQENGSFTHLPQKNVDFGGGLERLLAAVEDKSDVFETSLFSPIIKEIERVTGKTYTQHQTQMRIVTDHLIATSFIALSGIKPSNVEQGYLLRRLIRRSYDNLQKMGGNDITPVLRTIVGQYQDTDPELVPHFEEIKNTILEEGQKYGRTLTQAKKFIHKKYKVSDELMGKQEIRARDAFSLYTTHGLSPTQIESLGFVYNRQQFAELMEQHQKTSKQGAEKKFKGGLADTEEKTVMGHTATHLLHQALKDMLGDKVHQTGSNITTKRVRFDFNFDNKLTDEQLNQLEQTVNQKIKENLPVRFEMLPVDKAKEIGAIGLFDEKYDKTVKVYIMGGSGKAGDYNAYSKEFCGGPHVDFTGKVKSFTIIKQERLGNNQIRLYAKVCE